MRLHQWLLGRPFVYDVIRPLAVGGLDLSPFYARVAATSEDVILDVGCGTGAALQHLSGFREYVGYDTDPVAITAAQTKHRGRAGVQFNATACTERDVEQLAPTRAVLCGLLHHLTDDESVGLLRALQRSQRLRQIVTLDIVFLEGERISNALARMDRGRYCRVPQGYFDLAARAGLRMTDSTVLRSHPRHGLAKYQIMDLAPG